MFILDEFNKNIYEVLNTYNVSEQSLEVVELMHKVTKAKIILLICEDENRVFNIAFRTPVINGKGIPHILEHSVLCGSRKYNIKDPFIELAKGSLNTFLNAMTFPDKTCYPVASANLKDFHNLVDVYLDAVFYPNAIKNDKIFKQEGWHYEIEDEKSDLKVNGVVYNEMKGVYSDPDSVLETSILKNLYANTNYAYESGGDPSEIIDLTFEEFVNFHHKYYSPTNSIIYYYGKLDYNYELRCLEENYLKDFKKIDVDVTFKEINTFDKDKEHIDYYNLDSENIEDKSLIAYTFALPFEKSSLMNIVIEIINYVLFTSDSAILKEKLMNEGFGESITPHYEIGLKNGFYSITARNLNANKKDAFINCIISFIKNIVENGLDVDMFKAGINSNYFVYEEDDFGRLPKGLYMTLVSLDSYLYGEDPTIFVKYKEACEYLKSIDLTDKNNIFIKTLKDLFLDNKRTAINVLKAKTGYSKEKEETLYNILNDRKKKLDSTELSNVIKEMHELKNYQKEKDSEEAIKSIPMLTLSDIERDKKIIDYETDSIEGIETMLNFKNDKDIVYISLHFDISSFKNEELYLLSIIYSAIAKMDLENISLHDLNNLIGINTGGFNVSLEVSDDKTFIAFNIKSIYDKIGIAFDILYRIFTETVFRDNKKISLIINETKVNSYASILSAGHLASSIRSRSTLDYQGSIKDKLMNCGISFYRFIHSMSKIYDKESKTVNSTLKLLYNKMKNEKMYLALCTNKNHYDSVKNAFKDFINKFKTADSNNYTVDDKTSLDKNIIELSNIVKFNEFEKKVNKEAIITPNDINFVSVSNNFNKEYYDGRAYVLKTLFNYEYLWTNTRVLGGAYGCMSQIDKIGNYTFASYRDPNLINTINIFKGVKDFLLNKKTSDDELLKYIIGSISAFDNPLSVIARHKLTIASYFNHIDNNDLNKLRHDILNMKTSDFNDLSKIFDNVETQSECALITENKLDEAKEYYDVVWKLES